MRLAAGIEYDGTDYSGWQRQAHGLGVQQVVEQALSTVADHPVEVTCAGRTDAGVHATAQVVHFDTPAQRPLRGWLLGANANLPASVSLRWVQPVAEDFHARFGATARAYRYVIHCATARPALLRERVAWTHKRLDPEPMQQAADSLLGEHDFSAFRAVACQAKHPVRELQRLEVTASGDFLYLDVQANAFLHHMVRNLAGTLMAIGCGERPVAWAREVLEGRDRRLGGVTAPAAGLYLVRVEYPPRFGLPTAGQVPSFG